MKVYGAINNDKIKKVEVTLSDGTIVTQTEFYDDLFLVIYEAENKKDAYFDSIRGYDDENHIIFDSDY